MSDHLRLIGRAGEQARIARMLEAAERTGDALVICGPPGIGKSALLDWAADAAGDDIRVVRSTGFLAELGVPYAGLHQVLRPLLARATSLSPRRQDALEAAFGRVPGRQPDLYAVGMSALELLAEAAVEKPLLVLVDDVHWLDPASQQALAFIARRTAAERIVLLATQRDTEPGPMLDRAFPIIDLEPLDPASAVEVLDQAAQAPDARTRSLILDVAEGNPLALRELPRSITIAAGHDAARLPLTTRLEDSFTSRLDDLDTATRTALEVAASNDSDDLAEVVAATGLLLDRVPANVLGPAVFVGLVDVRDDAVCFSHPLVRSSVYQRLAPETRRARHAALARVTHDEPERSVRHRAAAALHPDALLATALEHSADRALECGATSDAVATLDRSAQLSATSASKRDRLFRAAGLAYDLGSSDHGDRLRARYLELVQDEHDGLRFEWLRELAASDRGGEHRIDALLASADRARAVDDDALALRFLRAAALRCWNFRPDRPVGHAVIATADGLRDVEGPTRAALLAHGDPLGRAADVLELVDRARSTPYDATTAYEMGHAAACVGAFDVSEGLLAEAVDRLRSEERLHTLGTTLGLLSWSALRRGRWSTAVAAADEATRLCAETGQPFWHACALAAQGVVRAMRGEPDIADDLIDDAAHVAAPHQFVAASAVILAARAASASAKGEHDRAFTCLARLHDPFDSGYHQMHGLWSLASFADAAVASGEEDVARKVLGELRQEVAATSSPAGRMNLTYAAAVLAPEDDAEHRLRAAVRSGTETWPHEHNRLLLTLGSWLRRHHRVQESRGHLRAARDGFDDLGSVPWAARARDELRATGERSRPRERDAEDEFSPQEAQIASMVAEGLSNREIGEGLFLSHRTVASHLYRMFPKVGVHSRVELVRLMAARRVRDA